MAQADWRRRARDFAETLILAILGGSLLGFAGVPAGFLSGALLAVAAAAVAGRPTFVPDGIARLIFFLLGVILGSAVSPETLTGMATWPLSIVALAVAMTAIFFCIGGYLRVVHGWDPLSAYFAAAPGALSQVVVMSVEAKANLPAIVIVQTVRVMLLAICVPLLLSRLDGGAMPVILATPPIQGDMLGELAVLFAVCAAGAALVTWIRFPGGIIFGAMAASAVLHGAGWIEAKLPGWVVICSMIGIGSITGSRFKGTSPAMLLRYLGAALGSFAVGLAVLVVIAGLLIVLFPFRLGDVILAFAPGAQEVMLLLALALNGAPVYIGAHHVARYFLVSMALPVFMRVYGPRSEAVAVRAPAPGGE